MARGSVAFANNSSHPFILIHLCHSTGYGKSVPVTFEIEPDVCDEIITDEEWLWQMLLNLLTNACKYTDKGEIHVRISLCSEEALQRDPEHRMKNTASWKVSSKLPKLSFPHRESADTLVCEVIDTGKLVCCCLVCFCLFLLFAVAPLCVFIVGSDFTQAIY